RERHRVDLTDRQKSGGGAEEADRLHELADERQAVTALQQPIGELCAHVRHREHHEPRQEARVYSAPQIPTVHVGEVKRQPTKKHQFEQKWLKTSTQTGAERRIRSQGTTGFATSATACARMYATSLAWMPGASSGRSLEASCQKTSQSTPSAPKT